MTKRRLGNDLDLPGLGIRSWDIRANKDAPDRPSDVGPEPLPYRTDLGKLPKYNCPENRKHLFAEQQGRCNGCLTAFPFANFHIDHIVSRKRGGWHNIENLQLLCGHCNSRKGSGKMSELQQKILAEQGI